MSWNTKELWPSLAGIVFHIIFIHRSYLPHKCKNVGQNCNVFLYACLFFFSKFFPKFIHVRWKSVESSIIYFIVNVEIKMRRKCSLNFISFGLVRSILIIKYKCILRNYDVFGHFSSCKLSFVGQYIFLGFYHSEYKIIIKGFLRQRINPIKTRAYFLD